MRKCKDIFTIIFTATLVVLAGIAGLFSLVFSSKMNTTTDSVTTTALQPAGVTGQGNYIFEGGSAGVDKNWYIELNASGPGDWVNGKRVGTTLSANITYVDFNFCWGSDKYYWYMGHFKGKSSWYSVSGGKTIGKTEYARTYDKNNGNSGTADICNIGG